MGSHVVRILVNLYCRRTESWCLGVPDRSPNKLANKIYSYPKKCIEIPPSGRSVGIQKAPSTGL
eukprot:scaffold765_cov160-Amphora_coffeaeformis.AAC.18